MRILSLSLKRISIIPWGTNIFIGHWKKHFNANQMEITNEIKAKVFAQYVGVSFVDHNNKKMYLNYAKLLDFIRGSTDIKLILRPLGSITDEDAIVIAKALGVVGLETPEHGRITVGRLMNNASIPGISSWEWIAVYQACVKMGYDFMHFMLGGKTLKEAGLAIYESDLK
jgi:hypothetical protein